MGLCGSRSMHVNSLLLALSGPGLPASPELAFPHRAQWYRPGGPPFPSPVCWSGRCINGCLIRRWDFTLSGWRSPDEPQRLNNQPVGLVLPHPAGPYRPGGPTGFRPRCVAVSGVGMALRCVGCFIQVARCDALVRFGCTGSIHLSTWNYCRE